jgi:hypothetical protein
MKRTTIPRFLKVSAIASAVAISLGTMATLTPATASAASTHYWPSIFLNHYTGVKVGTTLKVTGKGFSPNTTVTLYQCNQGMLGSPGGVFTKKTCDLRTTRTAKTSSKGTLATTFTLKVKDVDQQAATYTAAHSGKRSNWAWTRTTTTTKAPFIISDPTEPFLNPQTVTLTGLDIPAVASGTEDLAVECNDNVLSDDTKACGTPAPVTVSPKGTATGKLSVVMGNVGDGTCGTGTADEVCYIELVNLTSTDAITPIASDPIDFYEATATAHVVTVAGGGTLAASAAETVLTDGKVSVTCVTKGSTPASKASATIGNGTSSAKAPHPIGIVDDLAFNNCTGPLGKVTATPVDEPYPVNANSATSSNATATTISDIDVNVAMTGCTFTATGSAPGDYSNHTHILAMTSTPKPKGQAKAELTISNVSGCAGLIKDGDHPTYTSSYKISPATLSIKSDPPSTAKWAERR